MRKKLLSVLLCVSMLMGSSGVAAAAQAAEALPGEGESLPFVFEETEYGVESGEVLAHALRITDPDTSLEAVEPGGSLAVLRKTMPGDTDTLYLAGQHGLVKSFEVSDQDESWKADEFWGSIERWGGVEAINRIASKDYDGVCYDRLYAIQNPETLLYDIYNAVTGIYYEYGLAEIPDGVYGAEAYIIKQGNVYGVMDAKGKIVYEPQYEWISDNYFLYYDNIPVLEARKGEMWAFLDLEGILDGECRYTSLSNSNGGTCFSGSRILCRKENGYYAFDAETGEEFAFSDEPSEFLGKGCIAGSRYDEETEKNHAWLLTESGTFVDINERFGGTSSGVEDGSNCGICRVSVYTEGQDGHRSLFLNANGEKLFEVHVDKYGQIDGRNVEYNDYVDGYTIKQTDSLSDYKLHECVLADEKGRELQNLGVFRDAEIKGVMDGCVLVSASLDGESTAFVYDVEKGSLILQEKGAYFTGSSPGTVNGEHLFYMRNGSEDGQAFFNTMDKAFSGWSIFPADCTVVSIAGDQMSIWADGTLYDGTFAKLKDMGEYANYVTEKGNYVSCFYEESREAYLYQVHNNRGALLKEYEIYDDEACNDISWEKLPQLWRVRREPDGPWGYCDADGVMKIEPRFCDEADEVVYYGLAWAEDEDREREGVIDRSGKWLVSDVDFHYEKSWGDNLLITRCYGDESTYYFYNFSDIVTSLEKNTLGRDELFGEYHSYLNDNQAYKTMHNTLYDAAAAVLAARTGTDDNYSAIKTLFKGGPSRAIKQLLEAITGDNFTEKKLQEETAVELIRAIGSQESVLEEIAKQVKKTVKLSKNGYTILSETDTARTVRKEWDFMKEVQGKLSEEQSKAILSAVKAKKDTINQIFKAAGVASDVLQIAAAVCIYANLEMETVDQLLDTVTPGTTVHDGLMRLKSKLRAAWNLPENIIDTFIVDEIFKKMANAVVVKGCSSLLELFGTSGTVNTGGAIAIASIVYYVAAEQMDVPEYDDVVQVVYSMDLCSALSFGLTNKYLAIAGNYNQTGQTAGEELRDEYQFAYEAFETALLMAASKCSELAEGEGNNGLVQKNKEWLDTCITAYSGKMSYQNFINTCLRNMNQIETNPFAYRLDSSGNAIIVSLNGKKKETSPSVIRTTSPQQTAELLCIPETIDGHTVTGVDPGAFQAQRGIAGVFLPDTVTEIGEKAFYRCTALDVVSLGSGLQKIGSEAFSGCGALQLLKAPAGVEEIGTDAFSGCTEMTLWCPKDGAAWQYAEGQGIEVRESGRQTVSAVISHPADKQDYASNEAVDTTGLSLEITWDDGTVSEESEGYLALFEEKTAQRGKITVLYGAASASYEVSITPQMHTYHIAYLDESENVLAEEETTELLFGSTQTLQAKDIEGYTPLEAQMTVTAGEEEGWTFVYAKDKTRTNLKECRIELKEDMYTYTGSEIIPELTIYDTKTGKYLAEGTDYRMELSDNVAEGKAWIGIQGIGAYEGVQELTFWIVQEAGPGNKPGPGGNPDPGNKPGPGGDPDPTPAPQNPVKIQQIRILAYSAKIAAGKKAVLVAEITPANASNKALIWKSSNTKVATVNPSGVVTMKKGSGGKKVTITATAADGSGTQAVYKLQSMKGVVKKITISGKKTVKAGKSLKLRAKVKATKGANKKLMWISSNEKLATVSMSGKVKTKKGAKGKKVKITAMAIDGSGKKKTVTIKIR